MAMTQGTVSIAVDATVTKSGQAGDFFDAIVSEAVVAYAAVGATLPTDPTQLAQLYKGFAATARILSFNVPYVQTNGQAKIATADTGLQRTPNPNNVDTATQGPSVDKFVAIV